MILALNFKPFPEIQTSRLLLRRPVISDAPSLYKLRTDEQVLKYLDRPKARSIDEIHALLELINDGIEKNTSINWAVSLKGDPELIGTIGFWRIEKEHFRAEIGYMLFPRFHGKGIMNEALTAVLDYGFRKMSLHSVEANCNPENSKSIRLLEKNNFSREGLFRENYYFNGKFLDSAIYSLINKNSR